MTTLVTKARGGTAKPVGVLYVEPELQVLDAGSDTALADTGLEPAFTADLLSACLAHERCGVHLYRSAWTYPFGIEVGDGLDSIVVDLAAVAPIDSADLDALAPCCQRVEDHGAALILTNVPLAVGR
jgi:hypothetical protein